MKELDFFIAMQEAMDAEASETWNMVEYSRQQQGRSRLRLGEVTLTELHFYNLRNYWTKQVYLQTHEPNEARTGSDWEWLIGHDDKWISIRVQAKILGTGRNIGRFPHLNHIVKKSGRSQVDLLINPSPGTTLCRWIPLYVFYAASPPLSNFPLSPTLHVDHHGCSVSHARRVQDVIHRNTSKGHSGAPVVDTHAGPYLKYADSWSSIFTPLVNRLARGETLTSIVDSLHNQIMPKNSFQIDDFWDPNKSDGKCKGALPEYVTSILETRNDAFSDANLAKLIIKTPSLDSVKNGKETRIDSQSEINKDSRIIRPDNAGFNHDQTDVNVDPKSLDMSQIGVDSSALERTPARELDMEDIAEIESLPSVTTIIDIDRLSDLR